MLSVVCLVAAVACVTAARRWEYHRALFWCSALALLGLAAVAAKMRV
jgi:hypothetical protein